MGVTIKDFERYRELKPECERLSRQIEALRKRNDKVAADKVRGSLPYFPYTQRSIKIVGIVNNRGAIKRKQSILNRKMQEAQELLSRLYEFLEGMPKDIEHQEAKETLTLYYIDGLTYRELPEYMGLDGCGSPLMRKAKQIVANVAK